MTDVGSSIGGDSSDAGASTGGDINGPSCVAGARGPGSPTTSAVSIGVLGITNFLSIEILAYGRVRNSFR